jgi:hypothetical protein
MEELVQIVQVIVAGGVLAAIVVMWLSAQLYRGRPSSNG